MCNQASRHRNMNRGAAVFSVSEETGCTPRLKQAKHGYTTPAVCFWGRKKEKQGPFFVRAHAQCDEPRKVSRGRSILDPRRAASERIADKTPRMWTSLCVCHFAEVEDVCCVTRQAIISFVHSSSPGAFGVLHKCGRDSNSTV